MIIFPKKSCQWTGEGNFKFVFERYFFLPLLNFVYKFTQSFRVKRCLTSGWRREASFRRGNRVTYIYLVAIWGIFWCKRGNSLRFCFSFLKWSPVSQLIFTPFFINIVFWNEQLKWRIFALRFVPDLESWLSPTENFDLQAWSIFKTKLIKKKGSSLVISLFWLITFDCEIEKKN